MNVTAESREMVKRAKLVRDSGGEYVMVDIVTCGNSGFQTLREEDLGLAIHAHRAGHGAFTLNPKHGISMKVLATNTRLIGADQLHVGTAVGKMKETREEVLANIDVLTQDMYGIKPVMPVASGGLHPGMIPDLVGIFGNDVIIQAGGGVHGHPDGSFAGATAMRQGLDAVEEGRTLGEYAKTHKELRRALEHWKGAQEG